MVSCVVLSRIMCRIAADTAADLVCAFDTLRCGRAPMGAVAKKTPSLRILRNVMLIIPATTLVLGFSPINSSKQSRAIRLCISAEIARLLCTKGREN